MLVSLLACSKKDQTQPYVGIDTPIKNDKSVYKQEITKDDTQNKVTQKKEEPKKQEVLGASTYVGLSNDIKGWGLKRNSLHQTPEIPKAITDLVKKYNGIYLGDTSKKTIYLTFDEGYENGYTAKILDALKVNNVHAAFFITGPYVKEHADLVKRMIDEGHIIGNHTINHPSLPSLSTEKLEQEIISLDNMVYEKWKINMRFMRPPKGEYSERVLTQLKDLGHRAVFWSFAYDDYDVNNQRGTDYAYKIMMNNLHNGAVYLVHAVSKDNANALDNVIKDAKSQGYEFGTLDQIQ